MPRRAAVGEAEFDAVRVLVKAHHLAIKPHHGRIEFAGLAGQDVVVVGDLGEQILVLQPDLVRLQGREPPQLHLQDGVRLNVGEAELIHQLLTSRGGIGGRTDQGDDRVEIVEGDQQAEQDGHRNTER